MSSIDQTKAPESGWSPEEFILRGRYCPRPAIHELLNSAREAVGAEAAVLVAVDDGALLRSLCLQAPQRIGEPTDLVGFLRSRDDLNRDTDFSALALTRPPLGSEVAPFPSSAAQLREALARVAERGEAGELASWLRVGRWVPAGASPGAAARISAAILFRDPDPCHVRGVGAEARVDMDEELVEITVRVNATGQADARRDTAIMARLDGELNPADYAGRSVDLERAATALVRVAVDVSNSTTGACYLFDHGTGALVGKGFADRSEAERDGVGYRGELDADAAVLACSAFRRRRAIQLPPGLPGEAEVSSSVGPRLAETPKVFELATPIAGPLASPKAPAVGVLSVARVGEDAVLYGSYEMALLRNVALRIALITATANSDRSARIFADLSSQATARIRAETSVGHLRGLRVGERPAPAPAGGPLRTALPDELAVTLPAIQEGLETLGQVTGSHAATFRAALPGRGPAAPHGLTLRPAASYPRGDADPPRESQEEAEGDINWEVARNGEPEYWPLIGGDGTEAGGRRAETLSMLCVPVVVEGRVIGIVNFESASRNAYDALVTTGEAFAAHVGLAIAHARIAIASILHDYAIAIVRRGHELGGRECRKLREKAAEAPAGEWSEGLLELAEDIERKAKGLRTFELYPEDAAVLAGTMPELFEVRRGRLGLEIGEIRIAEGVDWEAYPEGVAQLVDLTLRDILGNVKRHSAYSGADAVLRIERGIWGGQEQDVLTVLNRPTSLLGSQEAANAFHSPLGHESRESGPGSGTLRIPQFGAYLAGSLARRVGGDVHLCQRRDGLTQVTLSVPAHWRKSESEEEP